MQLNKVWNRTGSILGLYDTLWRVSLLPRCLYMQFSGRLRWPILLRSKILHDQPGRSYLFYVLSPLMHKLLGALYHELFGLPTDSLSSYTTLLTPKFIVVKSNMIGYELDLKSFGFRRLMETNAQRVTAGKVVVWKKENHLLTRSDRYVFESSASDRSQWCHSYQHPLLFTEYSQLQPFFLP
jgi:hypothetical protein